MENGEWRIASRSCSQTFLTLYTMNELHTNYLSNFLDHLSVLGYQSRPSYKKGVEELLKRIELQGKLVHQIMASDLQAHHAYLLQRPNRRTGGALSIYTVRNYWYSFI